MLERYLADLHAEMHGSQRQGAHIGLLNSFFTAIRQHRWDATLPATAMFFPEDQPKRAERPPRALAEHVMAQVEHPGNLDRWDNPAYRLVTLILIRCGLRITDALRLARDCITCDADGAPYLRYFNHKMKREALVPIDEELHTPHRPAAARFCNAGPAGRRACSPGRPRTSTGRHRSAARPTGWRSTAGWNAATSATSTAARCISPRTSGDTRSGPG